MIQEWLFLIGVVQGILNLPSDISKTLSQAVVLTHASRSSAHVNVRGTSRTGSGSHGSPAGFRKMSSFALNVQPGTSPLTTY